MSTDIDKSTDDIVKAGVPAKLWLLESGNELFIL